MLNIEQRLRDRETGLETLRDLDAEQCALETVVLARGDQDFREVEAARYSRLDRNFNEAKKALPSQNYTERRQCRRIQVEGRSMPMIDRLERRAEMVAQLFEIREQRREIRIASEFSEVDRARYLRLYRRREMLLANLPELELLSPESAIAN